MSDLTLVRKKLEQRLSQLGHRLSHIDADLRRLANRDSAEHATEAENDEVLERLSEAERAEVEEIRLALERVASGKYGTCARCGQSIAEGRLGALPYATLCIGCAD